MTDSPKDAVLLRGLLAGLALALAAGAFAAAPAAAADRHDDRGRQHHVDHRRHWRPPAYGYGAPTYVPAPPPVVYAPPGPPAALNFIIPLTIR